MVCCSPQTETATAGPLSDALVSHAVNSFSYTVSYNQNRHHLDVLGFQDKVIQGDNLTSLLQPQLPPGSGLDREQQAFPTKNSDFRGAAGVP